MAPEAPRAHSARALEAAGAAETSFEFRGTTVTIPLDIAAWPVDEIRAGRYGRALKRLLGAQRPPMKVRADTVELSHRMADACGMTPLPETPTDPTMMFGAVPTVLHAIDNHGDDLEADLRRFYGVDYRDPAACTIRQVWVMIRRLPMDSATLVAQHNGRLPWTRAEIIAAQAVEMWTRKPYPGRPASAEEIDAWKAKQVEQSADMQTMAAREDYYASGQNMRDAGIDTDGMTFAVDTPKPPPPKSNPIDDALAVAMKNARRSPRGRSTNGTADDGPKPGFRNGIWDNAGSGF